MKQAVEIRGTVSPALFRLVRNSESVRLKKLKEQQQFYHWISDKQKAHLVFAKAWDQQLCM